jgi:hypothetical protein
VGDEPVYLSRQDGGSWRSKQIVTAPAVVAVARGLSTTVSLAFSDPFDHPVQVVAELVDRSSGIRAYKSATIEAMPGVLTAIPVTLELEGEVAAHPSAALHIRFADTVLKMPMTVEVVEPVPVRDVAGAGKLVVTNGIDAVVNLSPSEGDGNMRWHGASDLSAESRISYDASGLYVTVEATDDVHAQKFSGNQLWHGDSLHLTLQPDAGSSAALRMIVSLNDSGATTG